MTVIHPNSISGIASVTSHSNSLYFYESDHSTKLTINAHVNGDVTGDLTATNGTFSGDVTVGGTLTYDDVTNIDSVGVVTARSGLQVTGGNVGIDQSNPTNKLEVEGSASVARFVGNRTDALGPRLSLAKSRGSTSGSTTIVQDGDEIGQIMFKGADGTDADSTGAAIIGLVDGTPGVNDMPGALTFLTTNDGTNSPTERLRITSTGKLNIGSSSAPGFVGGFSHINVHGTGINANGAISLYRNSASPSAGQGIGAIYFANSDGNPGAYIQGQSDGTWGTNDYPGRLVFFTTSDGASSATERLRIASNGNVRIGPAGAPNLAVGGGLEVERAGAATIRIEDSSTSSGFEIQNTGGIIKQRLYNNQPWTIEYGGGERLRITSAGLVGVGVASPSLSHGNGIHIAGGNAGLKLQNTNNGDWAYVEYADESNTTKFIQGYRDSSGVYSIRPGTTLNATPGISLTSDGKMGVGCTPEVDFQVRNGTGGTLKIGGSGTGATGLQIQYNNSGNTTTEILTNYRATSGSASLKLDTGTFLVATGTSGTERLRIDSSGRVMISNAGTFPTSTNETLNVQGEGHNGHGTTNTRSVFNVTAAITSNTNGAGLWIGARTNENTAVIGTRTSSGNLAIETYNGGWGERLRIKADGSLLHKGNNSSTIDNTDGDGQTSAGYPAGGATFNKNVSVNNNAGGFGQCMNMISHTKSITLNGSTDHDMVNIWNREGCFIGHVYAGYSTSGDAAVAMYKFHTFYNGAWLTAEISPQSRSSDTISVSVSSSGDRHTFRVNGNGYSGDVTIGLVFLSAGTAGSAAHYGVRYY